MPPQAQTYTVKGGDNLFSIAGNIYKDQRMFAEIMRLNGLTSGVIRPGMVLRLPAPKPTQAINISYGLMDAIKAEDQFVKEKGYIPSQQELQNFQIQQKVPGLESAITNLNTGTLPQGTSIYQGHGAVGQVAPTPTTQPVKVQPTPSGYTSAMPKEAVAAYGTRYQNVSNVENNIINAMVAGQAGSAFAYVPQGSPYAQAQEKYRYTTGSLTDWYKPQTSTPEMQFSQQAQQQLAPSTPIVPQAIPQRQQTQNRFINTTTNNPPTYSVTFDTEYPNIAKSNLQEQQLPNMADDKSNDQVYLQSIGLTPEQANYYSYIANKQNLTMQDVMQFRYVFNVKPGSQLDQTILGAYNASAGVPKSNDQLMNSIWTELQQTGGFGMPTEWITRGGGGGGGGRSGPSGYSTGGSATYGGF